MSTNKPRNVLLNTKLRFLTPSFSRVPPTKHFPISAISPPPCFVIVAAAVSQFYSPRLPASLAAILPYSRIRITSTIHNLLPTPPLLPPNRLLPSSQSYIFSATVPNPPSLDVCLPLGPTQHPLPSLALLFRSPLNLVIFRCFAMEY